MLISGVSLLVVKSCVHKKEPLYKSQPPQAVKIPKVREARPAVSPRVAIILDDWGNNYSLLKDAVAIGRPVTLSILPNLKQTQKIAEKAFENGLGVMIHMPMEPKNRSEPLEPHTILTTSSEREIRGYLDEAILGVPHAEGMNNHMGSAATSDARVMRIVLKYLRERGLFFVDSQVVPKTVCRPIAKEMGLPFTKRDVFIDNEPNSEAIKRQLLEAKKIALAKGKVVIIGHDKRVTLKVIREMVPEFEKDGVRFVLVKDILE